MLGNLTGWHLVLVLAIVLLLFGAPKLPALARSIAQSMRIFKSEVKSDEPDTLEATVAEVEAEPAVPAPASTKSSTKSSSAKSEPAKAKKSSSGKSAAKS
jgi:sec-independent protein translocase protein TatA